MLGLLLIASVMQVFGGRVLAWDIPADWRWLAAALAILVFIVLELCGAAFNRKALTTTFDSAVRTVVQHGTHGLGAVERRAPYSAIAGVEIANHRDSRWWANDHRYVLQARLITGEVWPLTGPSILREELSACAEAIELKLATL